MTDKEIIQRMQDDIKKGIVHIEAKDTYRICTDGTKEIMLSDAKSTAEAYYKTFILPTINVGKTLTGFDALPRVSIYVGPPDSGKTYSAINYCKINNIPYLLIMGREDLTLETLLEDFTLIDGKPAYTESLALQYLSGTDKCIIIIDEFNTLRTGVLKTFQPLFDNTSTTFEFKGKVYTKNMNCKFICTLNDKDKGISILPDAILSRSYLKYYDKPEENILSLWTGLDVLFINTAKEIFDLLDLMPVYGTRQLQVIAGLNNINEITEHLKGLLALRNKDIKLLQTPEVQSKLGGLLGVHNVGI